MFCLVCAVESLPEALLYFSLRSLICFLSLFASSLSVVIDAAYSVRALDAACKALRNPSYSVLERVCWFLNCSTSFKLPPIWLLALPPFSPLKPPCESIRLYNSLVALAAFLVSSLIVIFNSALLFVAISYLRRYRAISVAVFLITFYKFPRLS